MRILRPSSANKTNLIWTSSVVLALFFGVGLGIFVNYAVGVDHPIASRPIKVDYCFLFSHEDLFRGQPVETEAHFMQGVEGAGLGKEECPENEAQFFGPPDSDPIGKEWDKDIERQPSPAEFNIAFVGMIPFFPRYRRWYADARNLWQPMHHTPVILIQQLIHFERTR